MSVRKWKIKSISPFIIRNGKGIDVVYIQRRNVIAIPNACVHNHFTRTRKTIIPRVYYCIMRLLIKSMCISVIQFPFVTHSKKNKNSPNGSSYTNSNEKYVRFGKMFVFFLIFRWRDNEKCIENASTISLFVQFMFER